jgi:hypothetical protein
MYALDCLVCKVLLPYDREIVHLISSIICFVLCNYGELFTSGKFLYSILLKFIYLSDEEIILNSLTYLDSVFILLNEGGCCYESGDEFFQLIFSKGILFRLHQLLNQYQMHSNWLVPILNLLIVITYGPSECTREVINFSFMPILLSITQNRSHSDDVYNALSILFLNITPHNEEVMIENGIMSEVFNMSLEGFPVMSDLLISFAGKDQYSFWEIGDILNLNQRVCLIINGMKDCEESFREKSVFAMINHKVL